MFLTMFIGVSAVYYSIDIEIIRSDMRQEMQDWIAGEVLLYLSDDLSFNNITDILVDKLNTKYGKPWLAIAGDVIGLPSS